MRADRCFSAGSKVTSTIDFPTWFHYGWYGGLVCDAISIVVIVFSMLLFRRGTKWQLALALGAIVIAALLLGPAQFWYILRFTGKQASLSLLEIRLMLAYIILCGWFVPLSTIVIYFFLSEVRPRAGSRTASPGTPSPAPRPRTAELAPFVYSADKPWGWLVYKNGKFSGQELALKRAVVSIGREEDNEVWLDDETISRYHAELVWEQGQVSLIDHSSLNGVFLNGKRIPSHATQALKSGDELRIGEHSFLLKYTQQQQVRDDLSDPLLPQLRRKAMNKNTPGESTAGPKLPARPTVALSEQNKEQAAPQLVSEMTADKQENDISTVATVKLSADKAQGQSQKPSLADIKTTPLPPVPASPLPEASPPHLSPFPLRLPSKPPKGKEVPQNPSS